MIKNLRSSSANSRIRAICWRRFNIWSYTAILQMDKILQTWSAITLRTWLATIHPILEETTLLTLWDRPISVEHPTSSRSSWHRNKKTRQRYLIWSRDSKRSNRAQLCKLRPSNNKCFIFRRLMWSWRETWWDMRTQCPSSQELNKRATILTAMKSSHLCNMKIGDWEMNLSSKREWPEIQNSSASNWRTRWTKLTLYTRKSRRYKGLKLKWES